ncbi:1-aminocyclopropane-1-carboxylate oxidase-like protein [Thalictrum thalictroides]|uniref:1-aminocyclopropane-1-carboxylate oxidase-like protein n=1 Tax=Thalictrum thalictroides TaxID=46969 RepID=A0A7J6VCR6_THATH|nr:1-aminocyclopropane-1-carboxylate oxidase-like protein [Thalictrum thalictroides]
MAFSSSEEVSIPPSTIATESTDYNRVEELKAFDDTKTGVKGLVDSGLKKIPKIFVRSLDQLNQKSKELDQTDIQIPVIDLQGEHQEVVDKIMSASQEWGFFQVVNHGVPLSVMDEMIKGVIRFNEHDDEVKKEYHSRDRSKKVYYNSNFDLYLSKAANWRDTLAINVLRSDPLNPEELPDACRDITIEYRKHVTLLGDFLFELLSEGLGLKPDHLKQLNCNESTIILSHYYPACPEPELTLGSTEHTDIVFLTILLQNDIGGLQVLHKDCWVDVHPIPGALVVNIGDLLQITSNDKLKSVEHRVVAKHAGPRISVGFFQTTRFDVEAEPNGPIKELISEDSSPVYGQFSNKQYIDYFFAHGFGAGKRGLDFFRL